MKKNSYKFQFGEMTIFVREVKGIWKLDFFVDNKRNRPSTGLMATLENLEVIKNEVLPDIYNGLTGRQAKSTEVLSQAPKVPFFEDYAQKSMEQNSQDVEGHVLHAKKIILKRDILPHFGQKKIDKILPSDIKMWQNELLKRVAPGTVKKYRGVLAQILADAYADGIIDANPCDRAKFVDKSSSDKEVHPFSEHEINQILSKAEGSLKNILQILFFTGMRPGELIALRWEDVSFGTRQIRIRRTSKRKGSERGWETGKTKTRASTRTIDMLPQVEEALRSQFKQTGLKGENIFVNHSNKQFSGSDFINVMFKKLLKQEIIIVRNLYNTRHTFASQMLAKKVDIGWISKTMGHANINITLTAYAKFIPHDQDKRDAFLDQFVTLFVTPDDENASKAYKYGD